MHQMFENEELEQAHKDFCKAIEEAEKLLEEVVKEARENLKEKKQKEDCKKKLPGVKIELKVAIENAECEDKEKVSKELAKRLEKTMKETIKSVFEEYDVYETTAE